MCLGDWRGDIKFVVTSNYNATFIKPSISYKKVTGVIRCKVTVQMSLSVALFKKR